MDAWDALNAVSRKVKRLITVTFSRRAGIGSKNVAAIVPHTSSN